MADKNIGSLPNIATLTDDALFVAEQQGAAGNITGRQFRKFAEDAGYKAAEKITQGPPGEGFKILGYYDTLDKLKAAQPNPEAGVAYGVGTAYPYDVYIYDGISLDWVNNGPIQGAQGEQGLPGTVFTPHMDSEGNLSWTNDGELDNPETVNLKGPKGNPFTYDDFTEEQLAALKGEKGDAFTYEDFTEEQLAKLVGPKGNPGNSIHSITRTAGNGAPGTTDTYTVMLTDGSTTQFYVYNGKDGEGAGDMTAQVYDPNGKKTDIFAYVDEKLENVDFDITADEVTFADGETFQDKYDRGELTGPTGPAGQPGKDGEPGPAGADGVAGKDATINGVNALKLEAASPITATQNGDTLTLGLDGEISGSSATTASATLTTSGWSSHSALGYQQTVTATGLTAAATAIDTDVELSTTDKDGNNAILEAFALIAANPATPGTNAVTFYAESKPSVNVPVFVRWM